MRQEYNEIVSNGRFTVQYDQAAIRARAYDYTSNGIIITDARQPDNPIIDVNHAFERMTGYARSEVLGRNCRFLQSNDNRQEPLAKLRLALHRQKSTRIVLKNYRKDGSMFWNELVVSPVLDADNSLSYFIGILQDVSAQQMVLANLTKTNEQLETLNALMVERNLQLIAAKHELLVLKKT